MAEHNLLGKKGEELARLHLKKKAYQIIATNWRFKGGELDIVARENDTLVFVEVKTRSHEAFERPQDAVTRSKQKRIIRAANAFIEEKNIDLEARFDVISVVINTEGTSIEHIEDAFVPQL